MPGDLHTHTTFSDGSTDIEDLLFLADRQGISHMAVSDHDTALSIRYAMENPTYKKVSLLPATEITCLDTKRNRRVHLLCYFPLLTPQLLNFFELMAKRRNTVLKQSIEELEEIYPQFTREAAYRLSERGGVTFKTHVMRVLFECGYTDGIYKQLYNELFDVKAGKVLHEPEYISLDEALQLIKDACGVAVLAHPSVYNSIDLAEEMAKDGRIDGIEIYHPKNNEADIKRLKEIACRYDMLITGGSDFHGMHMSRPTHVGSYLTEDDTIGKIFNLAKMRKNQ